MTEQTTQRTRIPFPWATVIWVVASVLLFAISTVTVSLSDVERFVNDITVSAEDIQDDTTFTAVVNSGTFEYNVVAQEVMPVQTGEFTEVGQSSLGDLIFETSSDAESVTVTEQVITITYADGADGEVVLRQLRNPVNQFLVNERANTTAAVSEDAENTITFETTEEQLQFGEFVPQLIAADSEEVYADRDAGLSGTPLAQTLFENIPRIQALTITPGVLEVTHDGGNEDRIAGQIEDTLNDFYPRASLAPQWWLFTMGPSSSVIVDISPFNTGIALYWFTLGFALVELGLALYYGNQEEKLVRPLIRAAGVFLLFWSLFGNEPLWDFMLSNIFPANRQLIHPSSTVIEFTAEHLELVIVSSLITIPVGLFIGILVTRSNFRELLPLANNIVNSGQTVPTLAIVAVMAPLIGFGFWPAIIALVAYGLLPVVRNTIAGLESVDGFVVDSARGMGLTPTQILFQVELPIASRVIMAGVRTSMVINVGTATLGAFVGSGGLGTPIASGLSMSIDPFVLLGALPAAILAILIDYILGRVEYVITPRGLQI